MVQADEDSLIFANMQMLRCVVAQSMEHRMKVGN